MMSQVSRKSAQLAQKSYSIKKLSVNKIESFLNSKFDLNKICEIVLRQNHKIWDFNLNLLLYISFKDWRKASKLSKILKSRNLEETGSNCDQTFVCLENPDQKLWNIVKGSSKLVQD